ncbi:MAG: GMC family oxidoreductase [Acidobacteria bacterium]|nr:MAG: GMC family oxidoreductase [Acidobacteriota bacterium]
MKIYDAMVIGSGMTGGWAVKELTEKGLEVLLLEAGRNIDPNVDYSEHLAPYDVKFRGLGDRKFMDENYPIQKQCYACREYNHYFFVNDKENPYTTPPDKPFLYFRGRQVGGRSIMWGRQVYRWSDLDFKANEREGISIPWPVSYQEIEPWYNYVEEFIGVSGAKEGLDQLTDGKFLPPMQMSAGERLMREKLLRHWRGERVLTIGRCAILTRDHKGRAACHYCGPCEHGCITRSYFSTLNSTLPAAQATSKLTLRPNSVVRHLFYDPKTDRITGASVIDAVTFKELEFRAKVVFLCASTLESTRILLNSANSRYPNGLANSSGVLGHYLMDHIPGSGAVGTYEGLEDVRDIGKRPNGIYIARFQNMRTSSSKYLRGYAFQGESTRTGLLGGFHLATLGGQYPPGFGVQFKEAMKQLGPWQMGLGGAGECLPHYENKVEINKNLVDKWGIPVPHITATWHENELAMYSEIRSVAAEMLEACGCKNIGTWGDARPSPPGKGIHEMGTARMGSDPKTSVLNKWNQSHDIKNLFVTDGSFMVSSACQNPSITYMAFTARAANYAVEQMKKGDL